MIELTPKRRYLVTPNAKRTPHYFTDVLIVGGGIAGTRAALAIDASQDVVIVTKNVYRESNSAYAQGGIAGVLDPLDEVAAHVADTLAAGKGLCNEAVVERVVGEAAERIGELVTLGTPFDEAEDGEIALTREGGHSHRRIAHALGDATGKEIMRALWDALRRRRNMSVWEETFTIDLLVADGACRGALCWNPRHGKTLVWAKQTILATGGAGQLFRETTNPAVATGDGHAAGYRAGAEARDMEFMQFHPTVLYIAGSSRFLISEAVRGEGAHLVDANGHRFMPEYHELAELAPRDDVSRAITDQMEKTRHPCVYLDLSPIEPAVVAERFPHIGRVCAEFGLDIQRDKVPVRPGAHYMLGGLSTDASAATTVPGLWAAGEVTSSGLHGANRLASNSLLEGLVFGRAAGDEASRRAVDMKDTFRVWPLPDAEAASPTDNISPPRRMIDLSDVRNSLQSLMGRLMGIRRDRAGLLEAAEQVEFWDRYVGTLELAEPAGWELQNMLLVARLMIAGALEREESRGTHFRSDFPESRDAFCRHLAIGRG